MPASAVDMDARYRRESSAGQPTADVVWSSAMDMQMKLVAEGYAATYRSPEARHLPRWANYRNRAYGTTQEPVVFVYNRDLLRPDELPHSHSALAAMLRREPDRFQGKVTSFDIVKSGVGYMFAVQDRAANPRYDDLLQAFGAAGIRPSGGTGDMLTGINDGKFLIGYNMMGAYAATRSREDLPKLSLIYPSDYTLVLSRIALISKRAAHPHAARLWLDYLLSESGQTMLGNRLELYPIRGGLTAQYTADKLAATVGSSLRPIPIDLTLVRALRPAESAAMVERWRAAGALPK